MHDFHVRRSRGEALNTNKFSLADLRRHDNTAWTLLYDSLAPELRAYISRLGGRDADDLLGETMSQVVRDIKKFSGTDIELRPWIFRLAHNRVIDAARRRGTRVSEVTVDLDGAGIEPYIPLTETPDLAELSDLLDTLTPDQRAAVWLRYVTNLSLADTAEVMSKSTEAVAALTHRALHQLRSALSGE